MTTDYEKYRGKCKEMCEQVIIENPDYRLVRGFYYCPMWQTEEQHWWTEKPDGTIYDPTAKQFGSKGIGEYREFEGYYNCEECAVRVHEDRVIMQGRFPCCSDSCARRLVGL